MNSEREGNEDVIQELGPSLRALLEFERFHLHDVDTFQDTSRDPSFDRRYLPQNCGAVRLPCFWISRKYLHVYGHCAGDALELNVVRGEGLEQSVLLPIHPLSLHLYGEFLSHTNAQEVAADGPCVWAVPTSSVRTFLAWPDSQPQKAVFLKTSLHSKAFGDRRLHKRKVCSSVGLSGLVTAATAALPETLRYFPEHIGFVPRSMSDSGAIVRSIPREIKNNDVYVAPLFALTSQRLDDLPLLLQLARNQGLPTLDFIEQVLCAPVARWWLHMAMRHGFILEAHGQDLLLGLTPDLRPSGQIYYRDFEGLAVDWEMRSNQGLRAPDDIPGAAAWHDTYASWEYPGSQMLFYKLTLSLSDYLDLVLAPVSQSLVTWQQRGLISRLSTHEDDLAWVFSRHLFEELAKMFNVNPGSCFNVAQSRARFIGLLLKLRQELVIGGRAKVPVPH
jgi:hypothetical protein